MRTDTIQQLVQTINAHHHAIPLKVAIDGIDTAGKTTLADELAPQLEALGRSVIRIAIDDFHNPRAMRYRKGADSPEGYYQDTFDYAAFVAQVLTPMGPDGNRQYNTASYDLVKEMPVNPDLKTSTPDAILLVDGVFLLRPELNAHWDLRIHMSITINTLLQRAVKRDAILFGSAEAVRKRYTTKYIPGQRLYFAESHPEKTANIAVDNNDPAQLSIIPSAKSPFSTI